MTYVLQDNCKGADGRHQNKDYRLPSFFLPQGTPYTTWDPVPRLLLRRKYKAGNWSLWQGDEDVNKEIKQKNIYLNKFDPFYIFYKLLLYWSRCTTGRYGATQQFVAVDLLCILYFGIYFKVQL